MSKNPLPYILAALLATGCTPPNTAVTSGESQLEIRQLQTREFDSVTKAQSMRAAIATMQDLDFILDKVDPQLGTISGTKHKGQATVKMTVTVREKNKETVIVRANVTYGNKVVENPNIYQDFFSMLSKSLFLVQNQVD